MAEYYTENFESYSEIFKQHAIYLSELMKVLDDEIISMGLPPVGRTKELFRMTLDLTIQSDRAYREKHNIDEPEFKLTTYMSEDEILSSMRTALRDEFERYLETRNAQS